MRREARVRTTDLKEMKSRGEKISMLTAYDYPTACLEDKAGIDVMLVGDSLGNVMLGYENTLPVTMLDMIHHTKAVVRGTKRALVIADMPFMSFQISIERTLLNASRLIKEAGATGVKLEGGEEVVPQITALVEAGIPVMGHLGLTPQLVNQLGGFKVQGRELDQAEKLLRDALLLEEAGVFAIVLECIPAPLARKISSELNIPTIGIGAGSSCDGQVLVAHDMLGIGGNFIPSFVRRYASLGDTMVEAFQGYIEDVRTGNFPNDQESYLTGEKGESLIKKLYG